MIVIAGDGWDAPVTQPFNALVGERSVADHVPAADQGGNLHLINRVKNGVKGM